MGAEDQAMRDKFAYARKQLSDAYLDSAEHIAWVIARETGKNIGNDVGERLARQDLVRAIESFLSR